MGICYLYFDDDGLYRYQCSVWCYVGCDDRRFKREDSFLFVSYVLCLWRFVCIFVPLGTVD